MVKYPITNDSIITQNNNNNNKDNKNDNSGLASVDKEPRKRVAYEGGRV
ncbi:MAG TPA: hypothetical protein VF233_02690 [Nitrososphaeraceae archaeon]